MNKFLSIFRLDKSSVTFILVLAVLILISVYILVYMSINDLIINDYETLNSHKNIDNLEKLYVLIADAETGRRGYLLTDDKSFLKPYYDAKNAVDSVYKILRVRNETDIKSQLFLDTLSMLIRERFDLFSRSIESQGKRGNSLRYQRPFMDEGKELQDRIKVIIGNLERDERATLQDKIKLKKSGANFTLLIAAGGILLSSVIMIILFSILKRKGASIFDGSASDKLTQDELETIVRERTAEISQLNKKLYQEIDKLSETEAALQQSEQDYRTLFEQAHDAIMIFTPEDEKILNVNERASEIYGIDKKDFIGLSLKTLSKNIPDGEKHINLTLQKGFLYNFQSVHYKKNGTEMLMEINASLIDYKGTKAILSINRDITDRILSYIPLPGS